MQIPEKVVVAGYPVTKQLVFSSMKYVVVGFSTFGLDYFLNWLLIEVIGVNYLFVGYIIAPIVLLYNFSMHKLWSFRDVGSKEGMTRDQVVRYLILVAFNSVANMVMMYLFYDLLALPLLVTRVLATGIAIMWNFPLFRLWVYRKR